MQADLISNERINLILEIYKKLQMIAHNFHKVYCTFLVPGVKAILTGLTIFCCYGVVRMHGLIIIFIACVGMACSIILVVSMLSFAKYYNDSSEILFLMKSPKFYNSLDSYQKKGQLSLSPIKIQMGFAYFMDTPCVITLMQIVLDNTINLLITTP